MAYNLIGNSPAFQGVASPWARNLAGIVAHTWVGQEAKYLFADWIIRTDRDFIALPKIETYNVEALAFYGPTLSGEKFNRLLRQGCCGEFDDLIANWTDFGAAFVHFRINPLAQNALEILLHDGSIRIVNELAALDCPPLPSLEAFDAAIGSLLKEARDLHADMIAHVVAVTGSDAGAVL